MIFMFVYSLYKISFLFQLMKIIVRDIFRTFFPKLYPLYSSLNKQTKSDNDTSKLLQQKRSKSNDILNIQFNLSENTLTKRKSTDKSSKGKLDELNKNKSKGSQYDNLNEKSNPNQKNIIKTKNSNKDIVPTSVQMGKAEQIFNNKLKKQTQQFILNHRFYSANLLSIEQIYQQINKSLVKILRESTNSNTSNKHNSSNKVNTSTLPDPAVSEHLYKLSLYLNKQTNKQIFTVYEHILANPKSGISYQVLSKKLKTDIINISHYCCKLKKMRFVDWEHKREGIVVYPKIINYQTSNKQNKTQPKIDYPLNKILELNHQNHQKSFDYEKSFIYHELTLNENILLNVASAHSLLQGGLTNEEIKFKIMKHAQNKMVRRTVQGMKYISKNAQRQGKVFEFKYRKQTFTIIRQLDKKRVQSSAIHTLTTNCRKYLNQNYKDSVQQQPSSIYLQNQQLLLSIINTKLTEYISSIGTKISKRQCTPLKLNRYVYILNYLEEKGPDTEYELRRNIIEAQKLLQSTQNNGLIHKRSMIGILQGLKKIQLIEEVDSFYYPKWIQGLTRREKPQPKRTQLQQQLLDLEASGINSLGNKRIKRDNQSSANYSKNKNKNSMLPVPRQKVRMITKRQHLTEIFSQLLNLTFQKAMKRIMSKGFHRIMYVQRKNSSIPIFAPQKNLFYLLQSPQTNFNNLSVRQHATTLESFISQIDLFVEKEGQKLENFPEIQYQVVKYVRRNPNKKDDNLKSKYGKSWREKLFPLQQQGIIKLSQSGYETMQSFNGCLV